MNIRCQHLPDAGFPDTKSLTWQTHLPGVPSGAASERPTSMLPLSTLETRLWSWLGAASTVATKTAVMRDSFILSGGDNVSVLVEWVKDVGRTYLEVWEWFESAWQMVRRGVKDRGTDDFTV